MSHSTVSSAMIKAMRDFLIQGNHLTRLEALVFFGVSNLQMQIHSMRKEGWRIQTKRIPYSRALRRINEECTLVVPKSLPIREITLTEYWIER